MLLQNRTRKRILASISKLFIVLGVLCLFVPGWYIYHYPQKVTVQSQAITDLPYPSYSIEEVSLNIEKKNKVPTLEFKKITQQQHHAIIIYYLDDKVRHQIYQLSPNLIRFESPKDLAVWESNYLPYWENIYNAQITEVIKGKYRVKLTGWDHGIILIFFPSFIFIMIGILLMIITKNTEEEFL